MKRLFPNGFGRQLLSKTIGLCLLVVLLAGWSVAALGSDGEGWPRTIVDAHGMSIELPAPPQRIHTLSLGFDEITLALVDPARVVAIGRVSTNPAFSNVAEQALQVGTIIERDAEQIRAAQPDLVVASAYAAVDLVAQLRTIGVPVIVTDLDDSIEMHAANIRFLARVYGAEAEAERLIEQIEARLAFINDVVGDIPYDQRPTVLRLTDRGHVAGADTTIGGIIEHAGGINAAAVAGLEGWQQLSLEKVLELRPDVIVITEYEDMNEDHGAEILRHPALQSVPAVAEGRVYALPEGYTSTLSHWNVRGVEELAKLLYPEALGDVSFDNEF